MIEMPHTEPYTNQPCFFPCSDGHPPANQRLSEIDIYLTMPKAKVPCTKMTFVGLPKDSDRVDIIAYFGTLK